MVSVSYAGGQDSNSPPPGDSGGAGPPRLTPADRRALVAAVRRWHDAGCCVHPAKADGSKKPVNVQGGSPDVDANGDHGWGWGRIANGDIPPLTVDDIAARILAGRVDGIGVFTGPASGQLEMIEVEGRAVEMLEGIREAAIRLGAADLLDRLSHGCVERSAGGGLHFLLRVSDGPALGNTKLACRPDPDAAHGVQVLAETRGVGGWFVAAPSAGSTHKSGRPYRFIRGGPETIPTFTAAERDQLHLVFRSIDEMPVVAPVTRSPAGAQPVHRTAGRGVSPGDDFAQRTTWGEMLRAAGWKLIGAKGRGHQWTRPGKQSGVSATTMQTADADVMFVFSSSTGLPTGVGLGKFAAYAHLHHGGDFSAAAKDLHQQGYGWHDDDLGGGSPAVLEKPPAPSGDIRSLEDYRADLVAGVREAVTIPGLHLFRSPTGTGKSTATATALRGVTRWFLGLPDHANVRERVADLQSRGIDAVGYPEATADNCGNLEEFTRVQGLGLVAGAVLCPSCPFKDGCQYRAAVKAADAAPGRVGTHERLRRSTAAAEDVQVVVIDEAPESVIAPTLTVRVEAVMLIDSLARSVRDHWYSVATQDQRGFADAMIRVIETINAACLEITGTGRKTIPLELAADIPDDWQRQLYRAIRQVGAADLDADALQLVTRAAAGGLVRLEVVTDVTTRAVTGEDGARSDVRRLHHYLVGGWRPSIPADAAVILLDATADAEDVAAVAGVPVADRTPAGRLEAAHPIVQITNDITRGASSRTVAGVVDAFLESHPGVQRLGIIGHQHHVRDLIGTDTTAGLLGHQLGRVAMSCWFGAGPDRASNRWHIDCDHVMVLGTPRINPGEYRRWLVGHGLEEAARLEDGGWGPRPWEGVTVDGDPVVVQRGGYQDPSWDRAYRATASAGLMQAIGRGRSLLGEGVPVTVITNEPLGLPIRPLADATPAAIRETVQVVTGLLAGDPRSAKSPIENPYRGNCASSVPHAQVVTDLMARFGIRRRAAQMRIVAAIDAGRLTRSSRRGWVQVAGCETQAPTMPPVTRTPAPPTSDTPAPVPVPAVTPEPRSVTPQENSPQPTPSGKERVADLPAVEVVTPVMIAPPACTVIEIIPPVPPLADLMDLVDERAAILEFDGGLDRLEAERRARMSYGLTAPGDLKTSAPPQKTAFIGDDDQHLVVGVDHAAVAARSIPMVAAVLERFPGVVKRVMPAPRIVPRSDQPGTADRCSCGCADTVAVIIHGGRSTRLDCARCDRFRRFDRWYAPEPERGPVHTPPRIPDLRPDDQGHRLSFPFDAVPIPGAVIGSFLPTGMG
jgi:hypothetical protein